MTPICCEVFIEERSSGKSKACSGVPRWRLYHLFNTELYTHACDHCVGMFPIAEWHTETLTALSWKN